MTPTFEKCEEIRKDGEKLLKELELALRRAYLNFEDPVKSVQGFTGRFSALYDRMQAVINEDHTAQSYLSSLQQSIEKQRISMIEAAADAHRERGRVDSKFTRGYNGAIGEGLTAGAEAGSRELGRQVDKVMREMVDAMLPMPEVPGNVRHLMAQNLAQWVKEQDEVQDAFFVAQSVLLDVAEFVHQKLTIKGQIEETRDRVKTRSQMTSAEICAADECVGELAKRSVELDRKIEQRIQASVLRVKTHFNIRPSLVLDPSKAFLDGLQVNAGIRITQNNVRVDLGASIQIIDPTSPDGVNVNPYVNMNIGGGPNIRVEGQTQFNDRGLQGHSVRATLQWSF